MTNENEMFYWGYGCNSNGDVIPTKLYNPRKTATINTTIKLEFYKHGSIECTPEHKILMRNGKYKQAKDIKLNESVMPLYYHYSGNEPLYEFISNSNCARESFGKTKSSPTHDIVFDFFNPNERFSRSYEKAIVHHIDSNALNNYPDNLELVSSSEHTYIHSRQHRVNITPEKQQKLKDISRKGNDKIKLLLSTDPDFKKQMVDRGRQNAYENWKRLDFRILQRNGTIKSNRNPIDALKRTKAKFLRSVSFINEISKETLNSNNYEHLRKKYKYKCYDKLGYYPPLISTIIKYYNSMDEFIEVVMSFNHKLMKKTYIHYNSPIPMYDITSDTSNFAIKTHDRSGVFVHNCKSVHAEMNALLQAGRNANGCVLYLYGWDVKGRREIIPKPCFLCTKMMINSGITKVITRQVIYDPIDLYNIYITNLYSKDQHYP